MKWRQLFWMAFCVLELTGNISGSSTDAPTPTAMATAMKGTSSTAATGATGATGTTRATGAPSSAKPTPELSATAGPLAASSSSPGLSSERTSPQPSPASTQPLGTPLKPDYTSQGVPTTESPSPQPNTTAETPGSTLALRSSPATSEHPPASSATTALHTGGDSPKPITCHNVKEVSDTGVICLQLNESHTCIKLAKSEVDRDCLLLILVGERDPAADMLQESHWEKFGIKSIKRGSVRSHQDFSQKTLIALVTSGLLLAFLGLAGYLLMKRRSWSPAAERLAEDPYYTENGSQGNTMLMMPPQEQPELQEKPNLNGGTQENGTGQASSKNGHSARHNPADTEM